MDIIDILDKRGVNYQKTNNPFEILVKCTSGEHEDNKPSLSYNLDKNIFNCWSCGFSGGQTKFLQSIGEYTVVTFDSKQPYKIEKLRQKIKKISYNIPLELPKQRRDYSQRFKGISSRIFKEFDAFTCNDTKLINYLCIPVYQRSVLQFIEGRYTLDSTNKPKYYRQPQHASVSNILFPLDKITDKNSVILVEGIFDMLNMWQLGYTNTLCIFGANNFNEKKVNLLDSIGTTRVYIMMDGDIAGRKAAEKILKFLDYSNIFATIVKVPEGRDPGNITKEEVRILFDE